MKNKIKEILKQFAHELIAIKDTPIQELLEQVEKVSEGVAEEILELTGGSDSSPVLKGQPPVNEGYASIKDYFEEKYLIKLQEIGKDVSRLDADSLMVHFHDWVWSFIEQQLTKSQEKTIEEIKMLVETESDCIEDGNTLSPEEQELAIEVCTNILGRIDGQFDISQLTEKEIENEN